MAETSADRKALNAASRNERLSGLLSRVALKDQSAFAALYEQTSPHLFGVAVRIVREAPAAEELLQDAFVSIWHHADSYEASRSQPFTWLNTIVRNRCLDWLRRRELLTVPLGTEDDEGGGFEPPTGDPTPEEMLLSGADAHAVRQCVETLDAGPRQAIALAFYQGMSHTELAKHLRQPLGTVKSWVRRGLEKLKRCLDHAGFARD